MYFKQPFLGLLSKKAKKSVYWLYLCVKNRVTIKVSKMNTVYEF